MIQRKAPVGRRRRRHARAAAPARPAGRAETEGPQMDVREYTELFPSALPAARGDDVRAWVSVAVGCDNALHVLHRAARPRRAALAAMGDILAEVQGLAGRGRRGGHAARSEREHVRPRSHGAGLGPAAAVRDAPAGGRPGRRAPADPLHRRRTRTTSPPTWSRRWRTSEQVCEHIHFPLQSGSDRVLRAMQRSYRRERYLAWLRAHPRGDPGDRRLDRHHRGLPGRDRGGLRRHAGRGRAAPASTARTRSSTRPGPGRERRPWTTRSPRRSCRSASTDSWRCRSDLRWSATARRSDGSSRSSSRATGNARARPSREPRTNRIVHLARRRSAEHLRRRARHRRRRASPDRPRWSHAPHRPPAGPMRCALVGPTASGKTEAALAIAPRSAPRSLRSTRCSCTGGWMSARRSPPPSSALRLPHHLLDLAEPSERVHRRSVPGARRRRPARVGRPPAPGGGFGPVLPCRGRRPRVPAGGSGGAGVARGRGRRPRRGRAVPPARRDRPGRRRADRARRTSAGSIRALEVSAITGAPFSDFAAAWEVYDPTRVRVGGHPARRADRSRHGFAGRVARDAG